MTNDRPLPSLPQHDDLEAQATRAFNVRLARTEYNYMFSYLEPIPFSADLPPGENFNAIYDQKVIPVVSKIVENFVTVMKKLLTREVQGAFDDHLREPFRNLCTALEAVKKNDHGLGLLKEPRAVEHLLESIADMIDRLRGATRNLSELPKDLDTVLSSLRVTYEAIKRQGAAGFLKVGLFDIINPEDRAACFDPKSVDDYRVLFNELPLPESARIAPLPWMQLGPDEHPWAQDWFLGYQQIAGYNTTKLQGVTNQSSGSGVSLQALLAKFPISDEVFRRSVGNAGVTLEGAAAAGRLYVVDYRSLEGVPSGVVFGQRRYHGAPIALFYWNSEPPPGYPPLNEETRGVMQPVAIQLEQKHDPVTAPLFTPHDGGKWAVAKYLLQNACAIEHETIAHLGDTHLTIEPMVVAAHRQLSTKHPILILLIPHFRFTLAVNNDALHSLVVPGGTLAVNLSPTIDGSLDMVRNAHLAWRFDQQAPPRLFKERAVSADSLPNFPFRDDTLLLWQAIHNFVGKYLRLYYRDDADLLQDYELQAWVNEMVSPRCASVRGMDGLVDIGTPEEPKVQIRSLDYLAQVLTQIIYIAGPLHASVNYAQYPLMAFSPSVAGAAYRPPPTAGSPAEPVVKWMPPLDVALNQVSFTYLLSEVQYDTLGVYTSESRDPYFADPRADLAAAEMMLELAEAELKIRARNRLRPIPYQFQLPSRVPNSISI